MDFTNYIIPIQWIGTAIAGLLSLVGIAKIVEIIVARFLTKRDAKNVLKIEVAKEELRAKLETNELLSNRLQLVEARLDKIQDELRSHMEANARLSVENEFLKKENERLHKELAEIRKDLDQRAGRSRALEDQLAKAEAKIEQLVLKIAGIDKL